MYGFLCICIDKYYKLYKVWKVSRFKSSWILLDLISNRWRKNWSNFSIHFQIFTIVMWENIFEPLPKLRNFVESRSNRVNLTGLSFVNASLGISAVSLSLIDPCFQPNIETCESKENNNGCRDRNFHSLSVYKFVLLNWKVI